MKLPSSSMPRFFSKRFSVFASMPSAHNTQSLFSNFKEESANVISVSNPPSQALQALAFADHDLHIHVPAGAVPKDGPSAGITLVTALASLVTGKAVGTEYAMTGEVSLRGGVMPIGGLPEKLMAAQRAGIQKVFIPYDNIEDLEDVADEVKQKLEIIPVKKVTDVLDQVLTN